MKRYLFVTMIVRKIGHVCVARNFTTRACVVGSGPAGFYAAKELKQQMNIDVVDIIEKKPYIHGLVRSGIAPDHFNDKVVSNDFDKMIEKKNEFRLFANVEIGKDITLEQLKNDYPIIILAYGAQKERLLNLENENAINMSSARKFASWYNSDLAENDSKSFFEKLLINNEFKSKENECDTVVIVGNGNVALDAARLIMKDQNQFNSTDIAPYAQKVLKNSLIKNIHIIGRRGIAQASFTNRELREMANLENVNKYLNLENNSIDKHEIDLMNSNRQSKRQLKIWQQILNFENDSENKFNLFFHFNRSITKLNSIQIPNSNETFINSIKLSKNIVEKSSPFNAKLDSNNLNIESISNIAMILRSIGYDSTSIHKDLKFDLNGSLTNENGRVLNQNGVYCCGWLKRGANGIVGTNKFDAQDTISSVLEDHLNKKIDLNKSKNKTILDEFSETNENRVINNEKWLKLRQMEVEKGEKLNKSALKFINFESMKEFLK